MIFITPHRVYLNLYNYNIGESISKNLQYYSPLLGCMAPIGPNI